MSDVPSEPDEADKISIIIFRIGAIFSMLGSSLITRDVWLRFREKKEISLTASIVLELSISDFCSSLFGPFLGTWMVPKESGAFMAAGTTASCTAQGFFVNTFYAASALCNASLALAYCLMVKKGWKDNQTRTVGGWLLRGMPLISLFISVGPLFDDGYNFGGFAMCNLESHPLGCALEGSDVECTRGQNTTPFRILVFSALFVVNVIIIVSIAVLIHSVCAIERKMSNYSGGRTNQSHSLKTTWQGIWYIAAFGLAWWPYAVTLVVKILTSQDLTIFNYIIAITWPAQGAYNAVVYFRPRFKSDRERHRNDTTLASVSRVLRVSELRRLSFSTAKQSVEDARIPKAAGDLNTNMKKKTKGAVKVQP